MDSLITAAARALVAGDPIGARRALDDAAGAGIHDSDVTPRALPID